MPLPILPSTTDIRTITERVNPLIKDYNRTPAASLTSADMFPPLYALDTGTATAYAIAPIPGTEQYVVGQPIIFKAANANSGTAPTLNVNGLGAGTISYNGSALVANDIAANGMTMVVVASTTPTFHLLNPLLSPVPVTNTGATTNLVGNVTLNNTANFFSGPNTGSIGANGQVWFIYGHATMTDTAGAAGFALQIYNGTSALQRVYGQSTAANTNLNLSLGVVVTLSAATTFTLQARDLTATTGTLFATDGTITATAISAVRLA